MSTKTLAKTFFVIAFFSVSIAAKYYHFFIEGDFLVVAHAPCTSGSCFVSDCSSEESPRCDGIPYKYITLKASDVAYCNPFVETCEELTCSPDNESCEITECTPDNKSEDESCLGV